MGNNQIDIVLRMQDRATQPMGRATDSMSRMLGRVQENTAQFTVATIAAGVAVGAFVFKLGAEGVNRLTNFSLGLLRVATSMENLNAQLVTSTGSKLLAIEAMGWIERFAAKTPYEMDQVTEAFIRAQNNGLKPMAGDLRIIGDTAAARGKQMVDAVEAIGDAMMGENERLKEFGVKARVSGDQVSYAYTNAYGQVQTVIARNSPEIIRDTILTIWNDRYQGAMDERMKTWDGLWSNMMDTVSRAKKSIMDAGPFDSLKDGLSYVMERLGDLEQNGSIKRWTEESGVSIKSFLVGSAMMAKPVVFVLTAIEQAFRGIKMVVIGLEWAVTSLLQKLLELRVFTLEKTNAFGINDAVIAESKAGIQEIKDFRADMVKQLESEAKAVDAAAGRYAFLSKEIDGLVGAMSKVKDTRFAAQESLFGSMGTALLKRQQDAAASGTNNGGAKAIKLTQPGHDATGPYSVYAAEAFQVSNSRYKLKVSETRGKAAEQAENMSASMSRAHIERLKVRGEAAERAEAASVSASRLNIARQEAAERQQLLETLSGYSDTYYQREQAKLNAQAEHMRSLGMEEVAVAGWAKEERQRLDVDYYSSQAAAADSYYESLTAQAKLWSVEQASVGQQAADATMSAVSSLSSGTGRAFSGMILKGENFGKSLENVFSDLADFALQQLARIATQMAVMAALNFFTGGSGGGVASVLSGGGFFHGGIDYVPATGRVAGIAHGGLANVPAETTYLLKQGERVLSPNQNRDLTSYLARERSRIVQPRVITSPAPDRESIELLRSIRDSLRKEKGVQASGPSTLHLSLNLPDGTALGRYVADLAVQGKLRSGSYAIEARRVA